MQEKLAKLLISISIILLQSCDKTNGNEESSFKLEGVWEVELSKYANNDDVITINYPLELINHFKPEMDMDIDQDGENESYTAKWYFEFSNGVIKRHIKNILNDPGEKIDAEISNTLPSFIAYKSTNNASYKRRGNTLDIIDPTLALPHEVKFEIIESKLLLSSPLYNNWELLLTKNKNMTVMDSVDYLTFNTLEDLSKCPLNRDTFWEHDSPNNHNVDDRIIKELLVEMNSMNKENESFHSFILIRNGKMIYEYYAFDFDPNETHNLWSSTKSVTSFLIGKAIEEGYINSISDSVISYFPDINIKRLNDFKSNLSIENLLTMQSGFESDDYAMLHFRKNPIEYLLNRPLENEPGTKWEYSDLNSYLLTALIRKTTGKPVYEYANEKLFDPLGVQYYFWYADKTGLNTGGSYLYLTPRDMAKFGYLYLQKGKWQGKQLINQEWISTSTKKHSSNKWGDSYGYHWWKDDYANSFSAKGAGGQQIYVFPDHNAVVVYTANLPVAEANIICNNLNKDYILPALN